ncbi:MAG: BatD family protein [Candidatus Omnitrophica bacterium]|nr:BatD family protein [Candidatus Omnitrophota bacterium]
MNGKYSLIMNYKYFTFICVSAIFFLGATLSYSKDLTFEASVNKSRLGLGETAELTLSFQGISKIDPVKLEDFEGFKVQYRGPSMSMTVVNGNTQTSIDHIYRLLAVKAGKFEIKPIAVDYNGKTYRSKPFFVEIFDQFKDQQVSDKDSGLASLNDKVFLRIEPLKSQVYVNEIIPVMLKLYVNKVQLEYSPKIDFRHSAMVNEGLRETGKYQEVLDGLSYNVIEFMTEVFSPIAGKLELGPATIHLNLIIKSKRPASSQGAFFDDDFFDRFFSGYEKYPIDIASSSKDIEVSALPKAGKPKDFKGAIGDYDLGLSISPRKVKAGDPLTLKLMINGKGNFKTVDLSAVSFGEGFKVYDPKVSETETSKIFEYVLIPKNDSVNEIPRISFSFFDSETGSYKTLSQGPVSISVVPFAADKNIPLFQPQDSIKANLAKPDVLGYDIRYIKKTIPVFKKTPGLIFTRFSYLAGNFGLIFLVAVLFAVSHKVFKIRTDKIYARKFKVSRQIKKRLVKAEKLKSIKATDKFYELVFRTLQEYLGARFHLPSSSITQDFIDTVMLERNVDKNVLYDLRNLFSLCDLARYSGLDSSESDMSSSIEILKRVVNYFETKGKV